MKKRLAILITLTAILLTTLFAFGCGKKEFTVTFDGAGGRQTNSVALVQVVSDASELKEPTFTKEGYTFGGWDTALDKIDKDVTITALWNKIPFTVMFNGAGGEYVSGKDSQIVTSAEEIVAPVYKKKGYVLSWDKDLSTIEGALTVNAIWTPKKYQVILDANGGEWGSDVVLDKDGKLFKELCYNTVIGTFPVPTKEGSKISHWEIVDTYGKKEFNGVKIYETAIWQIDYVAEGLTIKVVWIENERHSIRYNLAGGNFEGNSGLDSFLNTDNDFTLNNPTRLGYVFSGWTCEELNITTPQTNVIVPTGTNVDLNLTAHWVAKELTIDLEAAGGTISQTKVQVTYGSPIGVLPLPEKEGHRFVGWKYGEYTFVAGDNGDTKWEIETAVTLTATYVKIFTVRLDLTYTFTDEDGKTHSGINKINGESSYHDQIIDTGVLLSAVVQGLIPVPTDSTHKFIEWVYVKDGKEYSISQVLAGENIATDGVITLKTKCALDTSLIEYIVNYKLSYVVKKTGEEVSTTVGGLSQLPNKTILNFEDLEKALVGLDRPVMANKFKEDYRFVDWVFIGKDGEEHLVKNNQIPLSEIEIDGVITIITKCASVWVGPY